MKEKRRERRKTFSLQSIKINCLAVLLFDAAIWIWFWISIESNNHSLCSLKLDKQEKCLFDVEKLFFRYERSHFCVCVSFFCKYTQNKPIYLEALVIHPNRKNETYRWLMYRFLAFMLHNHKLYFPFSYLCLDTFQYYSILRLPVCCSNKWVNNKSNIYTQ